MESAISLKGQAIMKGFSPRPIHHVNYTCLMFLLNP